MFDSYAVISSSLGINGVPRYDVKEEAMGEMSGSVVEARDENEIKLAARPSHFRLRRPDRPPISRRKHMRYVERVWAGSVAAIVGKSRGK